MNEESIGEFHLYTSKEYLKGKRCGACKESLFLLGVRGGRGVFAAMLGFEGSLSNLKGERGEGMWVQVKESAWTLEMFEPKGICF